MESRYVTSRDKEEFRKISESARRIRYVSSKFRVISKDKNTGKEVELVQTELKGRTGTYVVVDKHDYSVNRLVYEAFISKIPYGKKVECVGERKIENLRIVSGNAFMAKKVRKKVRVGDKVYSSVTECAKDCNYSVGNVTNMLKGARTNVLGVEYV